MQADKPRTLVHGAVAGIAAGLVVAVWFLAVDIATTAAFQTPATLASALVGDQGAPTFRLVAIYTLLHFSVFALLGIGAAFAVRAMGVAPGLLMGAVFGLGVLGTVHYGALLIAGTGVLTMLPPRHVLAANVLGGMAMMAYLHRATRAVSPLGLGVLREHPLLVRGLITGLIGAGAVALWLLGLDIARGRPFYTPAALGSLLFLGASSPDVVRVDAAMIAAYTVVHLAAFAGVGVVLEWSATRLERAPGMWLMALLTLIILEGLFIGTIGGLSGWVLGALGIWAIGIANLAAVVAMGAWLWVSHPRLRRQPLDAPVQTRV
jgi:hypothetical protein